MTNETAAPTGSPHLFAAILASAAVLVLLGLGRFGAVHLERAYITDIAPLLFQMKDEGCAFQRAAAANPAILPMYGSSELVKGAQNKASIYFRDAPTGFQVSPVGGGGTTSITLAERIAAVLPDLAHRKVVISLSPSWFLRQRVNPHFYAGNFSAMQAHEIIFGSALSDALRRDFATRMLQFPATLAERPVLQTGTHAMASPGPLGRFGYWLVWPFAQLHELTFDLQDHFEALVRIHSVLRTPNAHLRENDKSEIAREARASKAERGRESQPAALDDEVRAGGDAAFLAHMNGSAEWQDFELLLRLLKEADIKPLILCIPMDGTLYDEAGISKEARDQFYTKLETLTKEYGFPLADFSEHDEDPAFLEAHHYHLTGSGWLLYDETIDDFYHDRSLGGEVATR